MSDQQEQYEFDAALSFAGENRKLAAAIRTELKKLGRSVFCDRDFKAHLWGKRKKEYERIYGKVSRFFVPLVSRHYHRKDWTQLEFSIAKRASRRRRDEYILPVQIDSTLLLGIPDDVGYLSARQNTPREIAKAIDEKCRADSTAGSADRVSQHRSTIDRKAVLEILALPTRRALLILATASLFHSRKCLKDFFPEVDWEQSLTILHKTGLVEADDESFSVDTDVVNSLRNNKEEWLRVHREWIAALEPLRSHLDVCAGLSLHYLTVDRFNDAATLLADAVEYGELGRWTGLYLAGLQAYSDARMKRRLDRHHWLRVLNGVGICLAHLKQFGEAIGAFTRLKREALAAKDSHWIGQAYLNLGVAFAQSGQQAQALFWYEKARTHGEAHKDFILVGRSLGNESQIVMHSNPSRARELITKSISLKRKHENHAGIATAVVQLGDLESHLKNFRAAIKHYEAACRQLEEQGMHYDYAVVNLHLGSAYLELGQRSKALNAFRRAKRSALDWEFVDVQASAMGLETRAFHEQQKLKEMRIACHELVAFSEKHGLLESKICAQHGLGIAEMLDGNVEDGRHTLSVALSAAKKLGDRDWIERCAVDRCRDVENGELSQPNPQLMRRAAFALEKQCMWISAGDIWSRAGTEFRSISDYKNEMDVIEKASKCYGKAREHECKVLAIARIAECQWQLAMYDKHFQSWKLAEQIAKNARLEGLVASVLGQRATSHQELGQIDDALKHCRSAIKIDRRLNNIEHLSILLHNLGEILRSDEQHSEAITTLREAEMLARSVNEIDLAISAAHNAGLAYQDLGKNQIASEHFQKCRNEAKQKGIWSEYVRAWEAMANLACCQGDVKIAVNRYKRALSEATKHGCKSSENRVALNYANLLWWEGSVRRAQQLLNLHCKDYADRTDAYFYHFLQASICEALDDSESAESHWQRGLAAARVASDQVYIAICAAGLGELFATKSVYGEAEKYFRIALAHEEIPVDRTILLRQLLEVLLSADKEKAAAKVFDEAIEIATANQLDDVFIDLYMLVFDHNWRNGPKSQLEALKAFVCAFGKAITLGLDDLMKVKAHVVMTLTAKNLAPSEEHLEELHKELAAWVKLQLPRQRWIHELVLFPLAMAKRMLPYVGSPRKLEAAAARELPEFKAVFLKTLSSVEKS